MIAFFALHSFLDEGAYILCAVSRPECVTIVVTDAFVAHLARYASEAFVQHAEELADRAARCPPERIDSDLTDLDRDRKSVV